ncbi:MFS transporter [Isoptericola jiangsuensis]|uniref:MFS transporter n=1 Tax=Isoptericola jiangsuensis TaxID=548579 RepID=UPI001FEAFFF9|nr:MFS transporter [Isoptericola jiangsuensis]
MTPPLTSGDICWLMLATFGASMAVMVPLSYGVAVRVTELAPGRDEMLGFVIGAAQLVYLLASPLVGIWSDGTRSRWGRRTPFLYLGAAVGLVGVVIVGAAPSLLVLGFGWVLGMSGWSIVGAALQNLQADKLPEAQRGKVSALTGLMSQVGPVIGIGIAYAVSSSTMLVLVVPGVIGALLIAAFPLVKAEGSSLELPRRAPATVRSIVLSYGFSVRRYPDFAWVWVGRFVFFVGLYFNTTFGTFFYAQRLGLTVRDVAGVVAAIGLVGVVAAATGSLAGGFLSDRLRRRRPFVLVAALLFAGGSVVLATAWSLPHIVAGSMLVQLAIAMYATVDQAIAYAVLPERDQAGRYMAVLQFAQRIPSAVAPVVAGVVITVGSAGDVKNFTLLYLTGAVFALLGGLIVLLKVKAAR